MFCTDGAQSVGFLTNECTKELKGEWWVIAESLLENEGKDTVTGIYDGHFTYINSFGLHMI